MIAATMNPATPMAAPIAPSTASTTITIKKTSRRTPKTDQASPRTSFRLRPKASIGPIPSTTIAGAPTDQNVSRISPGMTTRTKPIAMPMPARMPKPTSGRM
jgi:hypothetical protein